jgi:hypothetical protein
MKKYLFSLVLLFGYNLSAQNIFFRGVIYEHNSKTNTGKLKPIQNAQVIIPFSIPTTTDNSGKFKTETDGYKNGQSTKINIKKIGYEVVNSKELDNVVAGSLDEVKVYMAPQNLLYEAQLKYYNLAKKSVESSYDSKMNKLLADLNKNKILFKDNKESFNNYLKSFTERSEQLENERNNALKNAQDLSKKIAEINLDFANNLFKQAIQFFIKGDIENCLTLLNSDSFKMEQKIAENKIGALKNEMNKEAKIIKTLIDKEIFRAQLYQSKLQQDSVSSICKKVSDLNFKYYDAIGVNDFLEVNKKLTYIDPLYTFSWWNNDYFEKNIAVCTIKSGKGTEAEAEALRQFGVYKMHTGNGVGSREILLKALEICNNIKSQNKYLILLNLLECGEIYGDDLTNYFIEFIKNKNGELNSNMFEANPYYLQYMFSNSFEFEYATKILTSGYIFLGWKYKALTIYQNQLRNILLPINERKYTEEFKYNLITEIIKLNYEKNLILKPEYIDQIISIGSVINTNSIAYLDYINTITELYIDELTNYNSNLYSNNNKIKEHIKTIFPTFEKSEFLKNLPNEKGFVFEKVKTRLMLLLILTKSDLINISDYDVQLAKFIELWVKNLDVWPGLINDTKKDVYILCRNRFGVDFVLDKFSTYFLDYADTASDGGNSKYYNLFKQILCDINNADSDKIKSNDLIKYYEKIIKNKCLLRKDLLDLNGSRYGISLTNNFDKNSPFFISYDNELNNVVEDFYYGSDYALKCGKMGIITNINNWTFTKTDTTKFYDLWIDVTTEFENGNIKKSEELLSSIIKKALAEELRNSDNIKTLKFSDSNIIYYNINKTKKTIASGIYDWYGNSRLYLLDYFYFQLVNEYDNVNDFDKIIENVNQFEDNGFPEFFIGYSKFYGNPIQYLSCIYFYGIKAAMIKKDTVSLLKFQNLFNNTYEKLSDKNKLNFLNDFIWLLYADNSYNLNAENSFINFNDEFSNNVWKNFNNLLHNDTVINSKSDLNEDRDFEIKKDSFLLECMLTLSGASQLDNFDVNLLEELKAKYPNEARVYRNEALYYFRIKDLKKGINSLNKATEMGYKDSTFFSSKKELEPFQNKILKCFSEH